MALIGPFYSRSKSFDLFFKTGYGSEKRNRGSARLIKPFL
jgi:hypothetical protein